MTPQEIQSKLLALQEQVSETATSPNNEVKAIVNGKMQIVELEINIDLPKDDLIPILMETINKAILQAATKTQQNMLLLQQQSVRS